MFASALSGPSHVQAVGHSVERQCMHCTRLCLDDIPALEFKGRQVLCYQCSSVCYVYVSL